MSIHNMFSWRNKKIFIEVILLSGALLPGMYSGQNIFLGH